MDQDSEWEKFRAMFPASFGKTAPVTSNAIDTRVLEKTSKKTETGNTRQRDPEDYGPPEASDYGPPEASTKELEEDTLQDYLPITHEVVLKAHSKPVTALSIDPSCSRLASASRDAQMKLWDFGGMDMNFRSFKTVEPNESNPVHDIQFSNRGDFILVASASMVVKMYDRDGDFKFQYTKGDSYLRDLRQTKGHVANLTSCRWHPKDRDLFLTAAADGTMRIWDINQHETQRNVMILKAKSATVRNCISSCIWSPDGKLAIGSASDGSIQMFDSTGTYMRPSITLSGTSAASSLCMSLNNRTLFTRGLDDTVRVFDIRNTAKELYSRSDLPNLFDQTSICLSPDEQLLATGVSISKTCTTGKLLLLDKNTLETVHDVPVGSSSVIKTLWNSKMNQIFVASADGDCYVLYNPNVSVNGVKIALSKGIKQLATDEIDYNMIVADPDDYRGPKQFDWFLERRKREEIRNNPHVSKMPQLPLKGTLGKGGRLGTSLRQHLMKFIIKDNASEKDPREALLRHAGDAQENPVWVGQAYKRNQPDPVLASAVYEDDLEKKLDQVKKRRNK